MVASSEELAQKNIHFQCCSALLNVIANHNHPESQKYASSTLIVLFFNCKYLIEKFEYVKDAIKENMGVMFVELIEVTFKLM
jgi:hypothetical protein